MRIIDSVIDQKDRYSKYLLVEDDGEFAILGQVHGKAPKTTQDHLSEECAFVCWRKLLTASFYAVSKNPLDCCVLAERRIASLH